MLLDPHDVAFFRQCIIPFKIQFIFFYFFIQAYYDKGKKDTLG